MLVNGGKKIEPTILDRVQDGRGQTIYRHGASCDECAVDEWTASPPPARPDMREAVIDPVTAYQVTYMLKGVVDNGTGRSISVLGRPLGGKTGTTNDYKDGWFMGFSPDLVAGVYVGYDNPKPLAGEAGGTVAAPIFRDFMKVSVGLEDEEDDSGTPADEIDANDTEAKKVELKETEADEVKPSESAEATNNNALVKPLGEIEPVTAPALQKKTPPTPEPTVELEEDELDDGLY